MDIYFEFVKLHEATLYAMNSYMIDGIGIHPDVYIPLTPSHLNKDIDLVHVLNLIE